MYAILARSPSFDDEVDEIIVPLGRHLQANSEYNPNTTYYGTCGRARMQLRTRITSECPDNVCGPQCSVYCEEVPGQKVCNYLGEVTCLENFDGPNCDECIDGFYGPECEKVCEPTNSSSGHYTCDDFGYTECLPGYTDNTTNCVTCEGNLLEPDCMECDNGYYPQGTCDTFCEPRDDALGHYTCNSDGTIMCNTGYTDTSTNCVTCTGNFKEPDCTECDDDYYPRRICNVYCVPTDNENGHYTCESSGNKRCLIGYTDTSTNCVTCVGNYLEPDCVLCDDKFQGPGCELCIEHYYPHRTCNIKCEPRDDEGGHYICTSQGNISCLAGYTDPATNCVNCIGNFREPDCIGCDEHFTGDQCNTCEQHYYPEDTCNVQCIPRNDSEGHYKCSPETGARECLEGYEDPTTYCVTPVESGTYCICECSKWKSDLVHT